MKSEYSFKTITNKLTLSLTAIVVMVVAALMPIQNPTYATTIDCNDPRLSQNEINYWNPCENQCEPASASTQAASSGVSSSNDRMREAMLQYGEFAMDMQREWGTPWELVFAQMVMESNVGTAGVAVSGAHNNWLGITQSGDVGKYWSVDRYYAVFSSVEKSIEAWAGTSVIRNGLYDAAFVHTDPNNYDIKEFFNVMIETYAPADENDLAEYRSVIFGLLDGQIKDVREEKGWPSAAELAKKENIPIGGKHPIGGSIEGGSESGTASSGADPCESGLSSANSGNINARAIELAWPTREEGLRKKPNDAYAEALKVTDLINYSDANVRAGNSCDAFVTAVYRTTVDPGFACCGCENIRSYLRGNSDYREIDNKGDISNLIAGDIFVHHGHVMMLVELESGEMRIASASAGERSGDLGTETSYAFSDHRGPYSIFRYIGSGKSK